MTDPRTPELCRRKANNIRVLALSATHPPASYFQEALRLEARADALEAAAAMTNCPTCDAPSPHLHPAMQCEGEAEPCIDAFHDADDRQSEWTRNYIAEKRGRAAPPQETT